MPSIRLCFHVYFICFYYLKKQNYYVYSKIIWLEFNQLNIIMSINTLDMFEFVFKYVNWINDDNDVIKKQKTKLNY